MTGPQLRACLFWTFDHTRGLMSRLFISGLVNIETTVAISGFPLSYAPVHYPFHGIHSSVPVSGSTWPRRYIT